MEENHCPEIQDDQQVRLGAGNIDFRRRRRQANVRPDADIADSGSVQIDISLPGSVRAGTVPETMR